VVLGAVLAAPSPVVAQDEEPAPAGAAAQPTAGPGLLARFGRGRLLDQIATGSIEEQIAAARELGRQRDSSAVPRLIELLELSGPVGGAVNEALIDALGEIGDRRSVPLLLSMLDGARPHRPAVIRALGRIGDERALDPIAELIGDREVAEEAIVALVGLGPRVLQRGVALLRDPGTAGAACTLLARLGDRRATWPMVQALGMPQAQVRRQCAAALGQLRDTRAQRALLDLLGDPDVTVRQQSLEALVRVADGSSGPVLAPLASLAESETLVVPVLRGPAAVAAVPVLARLASEGDAAVRDEAVAALGRIGGVDAARALSDLLSTDRGAIGLQVADALARIGPEHGLEPLLRAARAGEPHRVEALRGLGEMFRPVFAGGRRVPGEVRSLGREALRARQPVEAAAGAYLVGATRDTEALGDLVRLLSRPEPGLRAQAAVALGWMSSRHGCDATRAALADPAEEVQAAAAWAAGELRCRDAGPELLVLLERGSDRVAANAAWAIGAVGERRAASALARRLEEGGPALRANVALALADLGDPRAARLIRRRLRQEQSGTVQVAMIHALGRLGDRESIPFLREIGSLAGLPGLQARDALAALEHGRPLIRPGGSETCRLELVDEGGAPAAGVWFTLALPDHRMMTGTTDPSGEVVVPGMPEGPCVLGLGRNP
jgi:HEAT repeat protein